MIGNRRLRDGPERGQYQLIQGHFGNERREIVTFAEPYALAAIESIDLDAKESPVEDVEKQCPEDVRPMRHAARDRGVGPDRR